MFSHHLRKTSPDNNLNSNSNETHLLLKLFIVFTNIIARRLLNCGREPEQQKRSPNISRGGLWASIGETPAKTSAAEARMVV